MKTYSNSWIPKENGILWGGGEIKECTYSELCKLISSNMLTPSTNYKIIDYRTIYTQPGSNLVMGREDDEISSPIEPLIVHAVTSSKLSPIAFSEQYPHDIVFYDTRDYYVNWTNRYSKGVIYRRIDMMNHNDLPFDFRNIYFRRYKLKLDGVPTYSASLNFKAFELLKLGSKYVIPFVSSDSTCPELSQNNLYITIPTTDLYISPSKTKFSLEGHMGKYGETYGMADSIPVDPLDYKDYLIFQFDTNHQYHHNTIHASNTADTKELPNIVFKSSARRNDIIYTKDVTICGNSYDNKISRIRSSVFMKDFTGNIIHLDAQQIISTGDFLNNDINCQQMIYVMLGVFSNNHISCNLKYVYSGNSFTKNNVFAETIQRCYFSIFDQNTINGSEFKSNTFLGPAHSNSFGGKCTINYFSKPGGQLSQCDVKDINSCETGNLDKCKISLLEDIDLKPYISTHLSSGYWHIYKSGTNSIMSRTNTAGNIENIIIV